MEKKFKELEDLSQEELKELASQLSFPKGEKGLDIATLMNNTNIGMMMSTIKELNLQDDEVLLELGHANCSHLKNIMEQATNISYFGLEISPLMQQEAEKFNKEFVLQKQAFFSLYDGHNIHVENDSFDKIMTVNTLYFWEEPTELLNELYRVLKAGGKCCIGFAQAEFMKDLPFVPFGFELYDDKKIRDLVGKTPFKLVDLSKKIDTIQSKVGKTVQRNYTILVLIKK
jgi:ubiquinone/menaquinone biosynthesis C-methylase UbiE